MKEPAKLEVSLSATVGDCTTNQRSVTYMMHSMEWMHPPILGTIRQVVCPEMCGNFNGVSGGQVDKQMDGQANSYVPLLLWWRRTINSLAPGKFEWNFRHVIFKQILLIDGWGISCEITLIWMSMDFVDD